jgi:hypothetical protein
MLVSEMMHEIHRHLVPDEMENYSPGHATPEETARLAEHLLVCEQCRIKLEENEGFAIAMKAAAARLDRTNVRSRWKLPVLAAAACLLLAAGVALRWQGNPQSPFAVNLTALRANNSVAVPAGRALELHPDLSGLPSAPSYRIDIVDQAGSQVWRGEFAASRTVITVPGQAAGPHFVRVYTPGGELVREYGLQIGTLTGL